MRFRLIRFLTIFFTLLLIRLLWSVLFENNEEKRDICEQSESFMRQLYDLTDRVHHVLVTLNLTHFLCFGSLWGQIRISKAFPWETKTHLCLRNEELISLDEVFIRRVFYRHGLRINYNSAEGVYTVNDLSDTSASVKLYVFEEDKLINMYRRVGWKRRVLPPDCENMKSLECFPPHLIIPPLQLKEFGGYYLPVPREGIEIQKYHYPDNWWKEITPKKC